MDYIKRIIDKEIDKRLEVFDAINIIGPKGCGKTRTAAERCKTVIEFQDEDKREGYLKTAETSPSLMLKYDKPILFDEWQDAPKIWGCIRNTADKTDNVGEYFLTGSTSKNVETPHTGTGRITTISMLPMALSESGESNGKISLTKLIDDKDYQIDGITSELKIEDLIHAACRGGWPRSLIFKKKESQLEIAKDYYRQVVKKDISRIDNTQRNENITRTILWSYARNMATTAKTSAIYNDVNSNYPLAQSTYFDYVSALERLYVIKDIDAWCPQIRSKTAIRAAKKKIFLDPSIGVAALGLDPIYFYSDFDLFGHVFENLVFRDLLSFSYAHDANVLHYRDDFGLETDAIFQLANGRYALIEIKTGISKIDEAEANLLKLKSLIENYNSTHPEVPYRLPSALVVICGTANMSYTTKNGVKVIPVGCLGD